MFPPSITDVRLDADRDIERGFYGDRRATEWRYTMTFDLEIDQKTYMDLVEEFAKAGWRGPATARVLGALVMNLQNGKR